VTVSEDVDLETVAGLLHESAARDVLTATSREPLSASELSERCDVSVPTAHRWTERLAAAGLLAERTRPREDGHHESVYAATLSELSVRLVDGDLEVEMTTEEPSGADGVEEGADAVDRLTSMWEEL
jgi:predicted transcriptional regulator